MSIHEITMPKWGMTMEEGVVTELLVAPGDHVDAEQAVMTVESTKILGELVSPTAGVLSRFTAAVGDELPVGTLLAVVVDDASDEARVDDFVAQHGGPAVAEASGAPAPETAEPDVQGDEDPVTPDAPEPGPATRPAATRQATAARDANLVSIPSSLQGTDGQDVAATVHAAALARQHGIALSRVTGTGRAGQVTVADLQKAVAEAGGSLPFGNARERQAEAPCQLDDSEVPATVHARQRAAEAGVNLFDARPTGTQGRVTVADVEAVLARRRPEPEPATSGPAATPSAVEQNPSTQVPQSSMRRVIGTRLKDSYLESPHFRVTVEARIDDLLELRRQVNGARLDVKVSVNDLVVAAAARALRKVPEVNAQYDAATQVVTRFEHADISVAVATHDGLITPIITRADTRTITEISALAHDLAIRAKAGTLKPDEFQGGTFTISNLGMFGVSSFDAIINPPQVAILAVGAAQRRFVPDDQGDPVPATLLALTLSSDHRVVDGALAARFMAELRTILESPSLIFA